MRCPRMAIVVSLVFVCCFVFTDVGLVTAWAQGCLIWTAISAPMPRPAADARTAVGPNGKIYAFGGTHDFFGYNSDTQEFDPATNAWAIRAHMPTARGGVGAATVNGKIYVIGGIPYPMSPLLRVNEVYDPLTDTWEVTKAPMPTPRYNFAMTAGPGGRIYAISGAAYPHTPGSIPPGNGGWWWCLNSVEAYNPATNSWETKASLPTYRQNFVAVAANGKIYAIGGLDQNIDAIALIEEYDPVTNTWLPRASLNIARYLATAVLASNGKIYVCGGERSGQSTEPRLDSVEEYDPGTNSCTLVTRLPCFLSNSGIAAPTAGKFYLLGGQTGPYDFLQPVLEAKIPCSPLKVQDFRASPANLWPPDHRMVPVSVSGMTTGGCGAASCKIISVSGSEPITPGVDWLIVAPLQLNLKAESLGKSRTYTIAVQCTDGGGNSTTRTVMVVVRP